MREHLGYLGNTLAKVRTNLRSLGLKGPSAVEQYLDMLGTRPHHVGVFFCWEQGDEANKVLMPPAVSEYVMREGGDMCS